MSYKVLNQRAHQGVAFVEVVHVSDGEPAFEGPVNYAVPGDFAPGTLVDITVTEVKSAEVVAAEESVAAAPETPVKEEAVETKEKSKKGK